MDQHTKHILWALLAFVVLFPVANIAFHFSSTPNVHGAGEPAPSDSPSQPPSALVPEKPSEPSLDNNASAFMTKRFNGISMSVPKTWRVIGENDTASLNTNSEALLEELGIAVEQGNNTILWAANARDDANVTRATMRLSVRMATTAGQAELREIASTQPREAVERELMTAAEETTAAMRKIPSTIYYNVTDVGLRDNGAIICSWIRSEYDRGKNPTTSDMWICPVSDRTFKLTTSYSNAREALYAATVQHAWRSLSLQP